MPIFKREFIAVPDDRKNQIVYKWQDNSIRRFSRAIVDADEEALFLNQGQVIGTLEPGQHQIDADELPFLGAFIDRVSGGNAYRAELFFVGTREYTGQRFGGRIDDVKDPQTRLIVTLRVFGEYSLRVTDPVKVVTVLTGTVDVTDNGAITGWIADQLLKVMRSQVTTQIVRNGWPVLGLSAYTAEIEPPAIATTNEVLDTYGLAIVRMGNFDVNLSEDDEESLKRLAKDTAYSQMAGGFQQYAAGEALLGAGEGMAKGGGAAGGAILATGLGVGQQAAGQVAVPPAGAAAVPPVPAPPSPTPPASPAPGASASGQGEPAAGHGHFCASCGAALPGNARFCPSCGTAVQAVPGP
ncbi:MAG TPA: SPFH domain-containing protein [Acidimicrobiales bacterium]|nr:SPFH domain-containing protein [Acidimicrobiales bacterium]